MKSVLVGISYGVDSFVAKNLLKEEGYEVYECHLDIEDNKFDKIKKFFVERYSKGFTPNICAYCNRHFKFYELNKKRKELNIDYYATGHYANIIKKGGRYAIKKSKNEKKDQSFMLYNLTQDELANLIFPINDMDKSEVREIARKYDISYAEKKDSLDICFTNGKNYADFIKEYVLGNNYKDKISKGELSKDILEKYDFLKKGKIITDDKKTLAYHDGIINYTIGKRIYIEGKPTSYYAKEIDGQRNEIIVSKKEDLYKDFFKIDNINFMLIELENGDTLKSKVRVTYRGEEVNTTVKYNKSDNNIEVKLEKPLIISKGQSAVFYDEEGNVLFGGEIM